MGLLDFFKKRNTIKAASMVDRKGCLREVDDILSTFSPIQMQAHKEELMRVLDKVNKSAAPILIDEISGADYRVKTVAEWLTAMRCADVRQDYSSQSESYGLQSSWVELFGIFENLVHDPQVAGAILTLQDGVASKDFNIVDKRGRKLDDATALFHSDWFDRCLEIFFNTHLYGFSLLQIESVDLSTSKVVVREVNRKHVRPDLGGVVRQCYDSKPIAQWNDPKYSKSTIFSFKKNLGALNTVVRWWIYKTEVSRYWAIYNQLYGVPAIIGQTDIGDRKRKAELDGALKNFVKTRWLSMGLDEKVTTLSPTGSATATFEAQIRLCDEQISKGLLASTMVMDDGASRAQGETHAENTNKVIKAISRYVRFRVNDELLPKLRALGLRIPQGARMRWIEDEKLTMTEKSQIVATLSQHYTIPPAVASEFVGIALEEKKNTYPSLAPITKEVLENYKKRFADGSH